MSFEKTSSESLHLLPICSKVKLNNWIEAVPTLRVLFCLIAVAGLLWKADAESNYYLVDNSGSMATEDRRELVQNILKSEFAQLNEGSDVSLTFFQGPTNKEILADDANCEVPVKLSQLERLSTQEFDFDMPSASGSTPMVSALDALAEVDLQERTNVVLITDGSYTCSSTKDVCSAVRRLFSKSENLNLRVRLIDPTPGTLDSLSCITASSQVPSFEFHVTLPASERADWVAARTYGALIAFLIILLSVRLNWWSRTTKVTLDVDEDADEAPDDNEDKLKNLEWFGIGAAFLLAALAVISVIVDKSEMPRAGNSMLIFSNSAFGSRLIPTAILGVVGWFMVQLWEVANIRREKKWRDKQQAQQRQIAKRLRSTEEKQRLEDLRLLKQQRDELRDEDREAWRSDVGGADDPLSELKLKVVELVCAVRGSIIQRIEESSVAKDDPPDGESGDSKEQSDVAAEISVSAYRRVFKWRPKTLARTMFSDKLLTSEDACRDLERFFSIWSSLKPSGDLKKSTLDELLEFEPFTMRFLNPS